MTLRTQCSDDRRGSHTIAYLMPASEAIQTSAVTLRAVEETRMLVVPRTEVALDSGRLRGRAANPIPRVKSPLYYPFLTLEEREFRLFNN